MRDRRDRRDRLTGQGIDGALDRRALLRRVCFGAAALPLLSTCGGDDDGATVDAATGDPGESWASGGTAAMTGKASYPDPFGSAVSGCTLVATTTEGPCTTATDLARVDVSEGWAGVPVRLALKVVDTSCAPLVGATVRIWHTNHEGSYSGQTPNPTMCLAKQGYSSNDFFRGVQTTSDQGTAFFDTCFPGWYRGRAIHIHVQVKMGSVSTRVSQIFFPEDVTSGIFQFHADYKGYGQPDTTFASDNIIGAIAAADRQRLILTVARMTDGAMLASKVITVRSA